MPIGWIAAASIAGPLIGGMMGADASKDAANIQAGSADRASANTMAMFDKVQKNIQPWLTSGQNANTALDSFVGLGPDGKFDQNAPGVAQYDPSKFAMDPSYQWQLQQGQNAITNNMAATGGAYSGNTLKALQGYSQGLASTTYQNAMNNYTNWQGNVFNRLNSISGTGANAGAGLAGIGMGAANSVGNNMIGAGNAQAAGVMGGANALAGGLAGGVNNFMAYRAQQAQQAPQADPWAATSWGGGNWGTAGDYAQFGMGPG